MQERNREIKALKSKVSKLDSRWAETVELPNEARTVLPSGSLLGLDEEAEY